MAFRKDEQHCPTAPTDKPHSAGSSRHGHREEGASERRVLIAALLTGTFLFVEIIGGLISGSLALLADAAHMASDTAALALAYFAFRIARRPADDRRTFGYHRVQVLVAFTNGVLLLGAAAWIVVEAADRFFDPVAIQSVPMLIVAAMGLAVNIFAFHILHGADRQNLNVRGALLHVVGDMLGSAAAIVAALVIMFGGPTAVDPALSVFVAFLVVRAGWRLITDSAHILIEGAPSHVDIEAIRADLVENVPGVADIHHLHAWALTPQRPLMTLHVAFTDSARPWAAVSALKSRLKERHGISHSTIEIDWKKR